MRIHISIAQQSLTLFDGAGQVLRRYPVSTASRGVGEQRGSYCTPRGKHLIRAKIGAGQAENTVFVARRPSGEIYSPELGAAFPERDWILTRILWLSGCEPGHNRLGKRRHHAPLHLYPRQPGDGCDGGTRIARLHTHAQRRHR